MRRERGIIVRSRRLLNRSGWPLKRDVRHQPMSADDWFRNTSWSTATAARFEEKLRRARGKSQYLRIQACSLADSHPQVALALLERYFALGEPFDFAQAHCDSARAYVALGHMDEAVAAYEAALAREAAFPNLLTQAYVELPYLVATRRIAAHYPRARQVLEAFAGRLTFPVDHFKWHAACALINAAEAALALAGSEARAALDHARRAHSGFSRHPTVGLVDTAHGDTIRALEALVDA